MKKKIKKKSKIVNDFEGGWNYRILRNSAGFHIHEVYYNKKGQPTAWSAEPDAPYGETAIDVACDVSLMFGAYNKPILEIVGDEKGKEALVEVKRK